MVTRGYSFMELYQMPVQKRNFLIRVAIKKSDDERKAMEKARGIHEGKPSDTKTEGFTRKGK